MTTIFRRTLRQKRADAYWRYFDAALDHDDAVSELWVDTVAAATTPAGLDGLTDEQVTASAERIVAERTAQWGIPQVGSPVTVAGLGSTSSAPHPVGDFSFPLGPIDVRETRP